MSLQTCFLVYNLIYSPYFHGYALLSRTESQDAADLRAAADLPPSAPSTRMSPPQTRSGAPGKPVCSGNGAQLPVLTSDCWKNQPHSGTRAPLL